MKRTTAFSSVLFIFALLVGDTEVHGQTPISRYLFDGDLVNSQDAALNGTLRQGTDSATAATGVATFAVGVSGDINGALRLNGSDQWVDLTMGGHPNGTVPAGSASGPGLVSGTVTAWIRTNQTLGAEPRWLLGSQNSDDEQGFQAGWNGTRLELTANARDAGEQTVISDSTGDMSWNDGLWHHLAFTWDAFGFSSTGKIYIDGSALTTNNIADLGFGDAQTPWEFPMALGARNNEGTLDGFWAGAVDDLQFFAQQLSDTQVANIFNATTPVYLPTPDFDSSGTVDGGDFLTWQQNFGTGTTFAEGNATEVSGDTDINGDDLAVWASEYGAAATPMVASVPEPTSVMLTLIAYLAFAGSPAFRRLGAG